ncbi:MAG: ATP-binding protein [Aestuariivita sp.]|nr:ATP-binding protein [Aestuariivita sp.]MCY4345165.1 ATP-binding protein [Aestuariivita sp.]
MAEFSHKRLQDFVDDGEKMPPPVFVGRVDILQHVLTKIRRTGEKMEGLAGNTTIIQGAPGAGKSSILSELERRAPSDINARVVKVSNTDLEKNLPNVARAIAFAGACEREQWFDLWTRIGASWIQRLPQMPNLQIPSYADLTELQRTRPRSVWKAPVIVAVDEVQRFARNKCAPYAQFMQQIHDASTTLPVTLVLAGLGDTQSVIRDLGLTHGLRPFSVGGFDAKERDELTDKWCAHFGIVIRAQRSRIDNLMSRTDGWPRHLHWAQQAMAESLLTEGVDGDADRIPDWEAVQSRADGLREGYYQTQYSEAMRYSPKLTGRILYDVGFAERKGTPLDSAVLRKKLTSYCKKDKGGDFEIPPGHTPAEFVTHLVHCGALQETVDGMGLTCPIPSFQSYILRRGGIDPDTLPNPSPTNTLVGQTENKREKKDGDN